MKFVCYSSLDQLPESANALFVQEEADSIFISRQWFECLVTHALAVDHSLVLACVIDGDRVMAILPLMECAGVNTWYSLSHGLTPMYSLLLAQDQQEQVLNCMAQALAQLTINALLLEPVTGHDTKLQRLITLLESVGFRCEHSFRFYNWIYQLQGKPYQAYMAERPTVLQNTIARKARKLEREHGYDIRLYCGEDVLAHMADYHVVYNASWKQNEIRNADFHDCVVASFSRAGWSRLAILYVKDQPVAAQLWFVRQHKASIYRLAYDKAWRQYSPGSILTRYLMEHVIDTDKVETIDFLTGNDAYKQDWMSERRECTLLSCIKSTQAETGYKKLLTSLKQILKRG